MKLSKVAKENIIEVALSGFVTISMFAYGFGKFTQFPDTNIITQKVSDLSGMQLMWAFYGYSKPFALIIGFLEVFGGILLLIKRTRVFGCLLLTTVLVNIILQDFFYSVNLGALKAAICYQFALIIILYLNKEKVGRLLKELFFQEDFPKETINKKIIKLLAIIGLIFALKSIEYFFTY